MAKFKLDLHEIYNRGDQNNAVLNRIVLGTLYREI
jgi:hypothetical protein